MAEQAWHSQPSSLPVIDHNTIPTCYHNRLYVGVSGSGKTTECLHFLTTFEQFYPHIRVRSVIIVAPMFHDSYEQLVHKYGGLVRYFSSLNEAMPELSDVGAEKTVCLVLIDDMACELSHSKELEKLVTTMTRHNRLNVSLTSQSIFQSSCEVWRTIVKNAHVIILTNSPRERRSTQILFSQLFGKHGPKMADEIMHECRCENLKRYKNPYFFIYLNLSPDCCPALRIVYDNLSPEPIVFCEPINSGFI